MPVFAAPPPAAVAPAPELAALQWKKRVVVVFSPSPADPRLAQQRAALRELSRGGDGRDLALVEVTGERVAGVGDDAQALRHRLRAPAGVFRALLIGKDGGVKLMERAPLSAERLAETIDAMPMRQAELRR